jgi:hypothetical protein
VIAAASFDAAEKLAGAGVTPAPKDPPTGSHTLTSRSRPTTRRRTAVTNWSPAGRQPRTPPICGRPRRTPRPRRSPSSRTFSRATSNGARRWTRSRRRSIGSAFSITRLTVNRPRRASASLSPSRSCSAKACRRRSASSF